MAQQETTDAQNTIRRMRENIYLNVEKPTNEIKKQYAKVEKTMIDLHFALDTLNDMKGEF